jgi:regulator of sigma E protease
VIPVKPQVDSSGIAFIGIRPPGKRFLEVGYPSDELWSYRFSTIFGRPELPASLRAIPYLNDGDVLLSVAGEEPHSITDLQRILGRHHGETVEVLVRRQTLAWIGPWFTEDVAVRIPSRGEYIISFSNIIDNKYGEKIPDQKLYSSLIEHQRGLSSIHVNGDPAGSFEHLYGLFSAKDRIELKIDHNEYQADLLVEKIGMLGFRARDVFEKEHLPAHDSVTDIFASSLTDTWDTIKVYPDFFGKLFSGRMSFMDTARGPVAMFAMAGVVFKTGLQEYLQLMAAISIALMVMNLLPFPVVDGGHLVLFLYEAVAGRPLSPVIVETIYRFGFMVLLLLGLWIMYKDILFFIGL